MHFWGQFHWVKESELKNLRESRVLIFYLRFNSNSADFSVQSLRFYLRQNKVIDIVIEFNF